MDLPNGARIYPHATTMDMLSKEFGGYTPQMSTPTQMFATAFKASDNKQQNPTAQPAPSVTVSGNTFTVREDADIDRIAYALLNLLRQAGANYQYTGA